MPRSPSRVDSEAFAVRRGVRDLLGQILTRSNLPPPDYEKALVRLGRQRRIALRQIFLFHQEGRVVDEVAALELLGRLARPEDGAWLSAVANDRRAPESVRVACALVLLGHDRPEALRTPDISGLVLRWQARFVVEEPHLRFPLLKLYSRAVREERIAWVAMQDHELLDPECRAAVFEMLLSAEKDPDLRSFLLEALTRVAHPACRAALRRVIPQNGEERNLITGALAALAAAADPEAVPDGWSARIGYCDIAGSFPLRFDFRHPGARPRSAVFVVSLFHGVRESLGLSGGEVDRYDALPVPGADSVDPGIPRFCPIPIQEALGFLVEAERLDQRVERQTPRDYLQARRLLDPLADLRPRTSGPVARSYSMGLAKRSQSLLDHPGYSGWFFDSSDHALDSFRLELLKTGDPTAGPSEDLITKAAEHLAAEGEATRFIRLLRHNARVHQAAGEQESALMALAAAGALAAGGFSRLPLVRQLVRAGLHPGHYFFSPAPDPLPRATLVGMMLGRQAPTKGKVFAVDLAWILARAIDVWLSRIPSGERPHTDTIQESVTNLAWTGARCVMRWLEQVHPKTSPPARQRRFRHELAGHYTRALEAAQFPQVPSDPDREILVGTLVTATWELVFGLCLGPCPQRCPEEPRKNGRQAIGPGPFPAGDDAARFICSWPGPYAIRPSPEQENTLTAFLLGRQPKKTRTSTEKPRAAFQCRICGNTRRSTPNSPHAVPLPTGQVLEPICSTCYQRFQKDPGFRTEVEKGGPF